MQGKADGEIAMLGRTLLTIDAVALLLGPWTQDFLSKTHIFNPRWPPHAK